MIDTTRIIVEGRQGPPGPPGPPGPSASAGSAVSASDFSLVDWGSGAAIAVITESTDRRGTVVVTAGAGALATASITLAFKTEYPSRPFALVGRNDSFNPPRLSMDVRLSAITTTVLAMSLVGGGSPVQGDQYEFTYVITS